MRNGAIIHPWHLELETAPSLFPHIREIDIEHTGFAHGAPPLLGDNCLNIRAGATTRDCSSCQCPVQFFKKPVQLIAEKLMHFP